MKRPEHAPELGPVDRALAAIEAEDRLDRPAHRIANAASTVLQATGTKAQPIQNALHGTWFGHPLHPFLVTLPIGAWTLALGVDLFGAATKRKSEAADGLLAAGIGVAFLAALAGLADWRALHGRERRTGLVHGGLNTTALGLSIASFRARRRGRRGRGRLLSAAGWLAMLAASYLGGHMVYRRRVGVDHADRSPEPRGWTRVCRFAELEEDRPRRVELRDEAARAGIGVALVRHRGEIHALGSRCSHLGGPLDEGWVLEGGLVCPWHGSRYCLRTGRPLAGPSTVPQPRYAVRVREGQVEIRRVPEPGDEALTAEELADARKAGEEEAGAGRKADEVLFEHHQLLRRLFEEVRGMEPDDPERLGLLRVLAAELEIHEHVEDAIFYPAVRPVSEDVPVAHAEHQELADMVAVVLRLGPRGEGFEEHLRALHEAVDHHASSEERSMFREAQRLGDGRLRELGGQLEAMLERERQSHARQAFRRLKMRLLEGRVA